MRKLEDVAKILARAHRASDPKTKSILQFPDRTAKEIRLVEISEAAPTTNEAIPFRFNADPSSGVDFPSVVILLSPDEWQQVLSGKLALPEDWDLQARVAI